MGKRTVPNWNGKFTRPVYTRDGQTIRTLADAREYALCLPVGHSQRQQWHRAAELMLEAASGGSIAAASAQIERALFFRYAAHIPALTVVRRSGLPTLSDAANTRP
jgi:hypothetical protein